METDTLLKISGTGKKNGSLDCRILGLYSIEWSDAELLLIHYALLNITMPLSIPFHESEMNNLF